jgi:hypothetical protein
MQMTFSISFEGDPAQLVKRARETATQNHVQFDGDEHSGNFSGDGVAGTYAVSGQTVTLTINRKPFYVTMAMIQDHLGKFFVA